MATVAEATGVLDGKARELDDLSKKLGKVELELESAEEAYQKFVDDFELGLWRQHVDHGAKLPPTEKLRLKLAHEAMDPVVLGRYIGLKNRRDRIEKRIKSLGKTVDAQRSILSALKTELEASR
jgi:hypothetical protein